MQNFDLVMINGFDHIDQKAKYYQFQVLIYIVSKIQTELEAKTDHKIINL